MDGFTASPGNLYDMAVAGGRHKLKSVPQVTVSRKGHEDSDNHRNNLDILQACPTSSELAGNKMEQR